MLLHIRLGEWANNFGSPEGGFTFWLGFDSALRLDFPGAQAPSIGLRFPFIRGFLALRDGPRTLHFGFANLNLEELGLTVEHLRSELRRARLTGALTNGILAVP